MSKTSLGFTLLEVLAALVVFGFLLAGIVQGRDIGLRAWSMQARLVDGHADLDAVNRTLRGIVARMDPGSLDDPPRVSGTRSQVAFTTELPAAVGDALARRADVVLLVDPAHRLVMRWTPHTHAATGAPAAGSSTAVLLDGVGDVRLLYLFPQGAAGSGWTESWSQPYLPSLVRIHLDFPAADPRHWPDIVAGPAQGRPRE